MQNKQTPDWENRLLPRDLRQFPGIIGHDILPVAQDTLLANFSIPQREDRLVDQIISLDVYTHSKTYRYSGVQGISH